MKRLCVLSCLLLLAHCQNDNHYNMTRRSFPKLSVLENIHECLENPDGIYYSVDIALQQDDTPLSQYIQAYALEERIHYNYSNLHRGVCGNRCGLNRTHTVFNETVFTALKECLNRSIYNDYGLQVGSLSMNFWTTNDEKPLTVLDQAMATLVIIIILLNVGVSLYYYYFPEDLARDKGLITAFAVQKHWKDLCDGGRGKNLLKVLEGFRFYSNLVVLGLHSTIFLTSGLLINSEYTEDAFTGPKTSLANLRVVMQVFFVSSGFLMANKILGMIEKHTFSWKSLPELMINRYLRITPTLMFVAFLTATWVPRMGSGCLWEKIVTDEGNMCRENWWHLATLTQNYFPFERACVPQSWSLAADWQLYNLSIVILLLVWKWPKLAGKILSVTLVISLMVAFFQTYIMDLPPIRNAASPESIRNKVLDNPTFFYAYLSAQANWSGYQIGVITAYIYRKSLSAKWDLEYSKLLKLLIYLSGPLMLYSVLMGREFHFRKASTLEAASFNAFNQNIFAVGVASIMLGSLHKVENIYIRVLKWGPLQSLSRLSYCSTLTHVILLKTYGGHQIGFYATDYNLFMLFAAVLLTTYVVSLPLYLFVEAPTAALQKMLVFPKSDKAASPANATCNGVGTVKKIASRIDAKQFASSNGHEANSKKSHDD